MFDKTSEVSLLFQREMSHSEFNKNAASVATNIQKLVQNVSSMQRMLVHLDSQGEVLSIHGTIVEFRDSIPTPIVDLYL